MLGFQDEVWWSRLARPTLHAWAGGEPKRLHEPAAGEAGTEAKALACYGLLRGDTRGMMLRFVDGRPVSQVTEDFLGWVCDRLAAEGEGGGGSHAGLQLLTLADSQGANEGGNGSHTPVFAPRSVTERPPRSLH